LLRGLRPSHNVTYDKQQGSQQDQVDDLAVFRLQIAPPATTSAPSCQAHTQMVGRDADGFQECVARIPNWNARMMSKNTWEVKNEWDRLPGLGETFGR
jgi:hypothetical protein